MPPFHDSPALSSIIKYSYMYRLKWLHRRLCTNYWQFREFDGRGFCVISADVNRIIFNEKFPFPVIGSDAVIGIGQGGWDSMVEEFELKRISQSIRQRFCEGAQWDETAQFKKSIRDINRGRRAWNGCLSVKDLYKRCKSIDKLYESMKRSGYQIDLNPSHKRKIQNIYIPDLIAVAANRKGYFIRCEGGRHRLAIAKILGIQRIPAILQIKHALCVDNFERIHTF
jgi:hypothetical protein